MSNNAQSIQDRRLKNLIKAMEDTYGHSDMQSGSNGDEYIFHCPLCVEERGEDDHRKHLRLVASSEGREYPYIGCRIHTDKWNDLRKALVKDGIPSSLLAKPEKNSSTSIARAPKNSGPGLGENDPIDKKLVFKACRNLLGSDKAERYRNYLLEKRGITLETIKRFKLGIDKTAYGFPRITIPIKNANGEYVNIRCYLPFPKSEKDVKILPWPHPSLMKSDGKKRETYGAPARIYGIEEVVEGEPIFVCAGEFDRILLVQNGINAVTGTSAEGTVPRLEDCEALVKASEIYLIYDCDKAGRAGAKKFCLSLMKIGAEKIKVVDLDPSRDDGYDITDFFMSDMRSVDDLVTLVSETTFADIPEPPVEFSDRHMAEVVAEEYADKIRYLVDSDVWLNWDGKRWLQAGRKDLNDPSNAVINMARTLRDQKLEEGFNKQANWYGRAMNTSQVRSSVTQMGWLDSLRVFSEDLDSHRNLLNVENGTLDLETGILREPDPKQMLSKITKGAYKPGLKSQMWTDFLDRFVPDEDMQRYLQRISGYCIEDGNPHRLFIVFKGKTSTGKSAFSEAIMDVLGSYAGSFNLSLFRDKQDESPRADIVGMLTQRVGFASETSNEWHLHADSIKRITGADTIKARLLYSNNYFERIPAFTPIIRTNAAPTIRAADLAVFRRLRVVPFEVQIPEDEVDPDFVPTMMRESRDAILSWIIDGYMDYKANGFGEIPKACLEAEMEFRDEVSILSQFIADHCITTADDDPDIDLRTPVDELYQAYQVWAMSGGFSGRDVMNKIDFGRKLSGLGFESKSSNGVRYRTGLALKGADRVMG